ncbi:MFS transporter [Clostridium botulinum]|uniref:MFS transporter n=1 Tax=Clostridium botulinum TaxID=1491 RepID=UPI000360A942|nr:MFS transporter [Clostridium botulinum]MBN1035356.1 MFS transporter [Clostridium botulinum]MBY6930164.1 MFS transporter [Clostridium botulinum]NFG20400.1 MFS transporter [Clostridium botulinum]NFG59655.1 MFS transporter [Clostridium botulinum]NFO81810.1 MFS transporter [Clostridium botulinum]
MKNISFKLNTIRSFSMNLLFNSFGNSVVGTIYVLFLSQVKGFSDKDVSLMVGLIPIITIPSYILWGIIIDKTKKVVLTNKMVIIANIVTLILLIYVDNVYAFFIINLIRTVLLQPGGMVNDEYLLNLVKDNTGSYGSIRTFGTVGYGLGGLVCLLLMDYIEISGLLIIAIMSLASTLLFISKMPEINIDKSLKKGYHKTKFKIEQLDLLKNMKYMRLMIIYVLMNGTLASASSYAIPMIMIKLDAPQNIIGVMPFIMIVFELILLLQNRRLNFPKKRNKYLLIGLILLTIRWITMGVTESYIIIILISIIHGAVAGILLPIQNDMVEKFVPQNQQSTAIMLQTLLSSTIVPSILNIILGFLLEPWGIKSFGIVYLICNVITLFMYIINLLFNRYEEKKVIFDR